MKLRSRFWWPPGWPRDGRAGGPAGPAAPRLAAGRRPERRAGGGRPGGAKGDHSCSATARTGTSSTRPRWSCRPSSQGRAGRPKVHVLGNRVKWKATLGSRAYGGPIIAGGKVFVGTNNENPRNKRDRGKATDDDPDGPAARQGRPHVLRREDRATSSGRWSTTSWRAGSVNDWPHEGLCSTPGRRGEPRVLLLQPVRGRLPGRERVRGRQNDGFQKEKYQDQTDGDVVWSVQHDRPAQGVPAQHDRLLPARSSATCCSSSPPTGWTRATSTSRSRRPPASSA